MNSFFSDFASWLVYQLLGCDPETRLGRAVHFFVEDTTKIFFLLVLMIYLIALFRASFNVEKVREYLAGKHRAVGYLLGSLFGAITPFCSCSSIPVFLGFISAGIPVGITMAFLITSPIINEVAILLLLGLVGWKITVIYLISGMAIGIIGGMVLDFVKAERMLKPFAYKACQEAGGKEHVPVAAKTKMHWRERHAFARKEVVEIFSRVWKWVIVGVGLGAALHGFVPDRWFEEHFSQNQWWSVPLAVLAGIPLYSNATGVIPVMEGLLAKGLPVGTTMAFCMSTVAASFPEFVMLKQVMQWRLLAIIFVVFLVGFTMVGWILNLLS